MIKTEILKNSATEKMETTISKLMGCWKTVLREQVIEMDTNIKKKRTLNK